MKKWAIVIGAGLALFPLHNSKLTELATGDSGVLVFVPAIGLILTVLGVGLFLAYHWKKVREVGIGDKKVVIPLVVISVAIAVSGIGVAGFQGKVALAGMAAALFGLYLVGRILGKDMFLPLAVGAAVASVGVITYGVIFRVFPTGGLLFEGNYDIVVGYVLLGTALIVNNKWQPVLAGLALLAMFLSGSPEALLPIGIVGVAFLVRKDWSKKLVKVAAPLAVVAVIWFGLGWGQQLYDYSLGIIRGDQTVPGLEDAEEAKHDALTYRLVVIKRNMDNIKPFGTGYVLTEFSRVKNVHNVPLVIVQQLGYAGIVAALAWSWLTIYCLVKTKWKYVWLLVIGLSVFDHFIWTQMGLWYWAIIGVTTASTLKSDLVFKGVKYEAT